jgi:hypothetical protein
MHHFTPVSAFLGGALIGLSASLFLLLHGRVAGITGLWAGLFRPDDGARQTRLWFVLGLGIAGLGARVIYPAAVGAVVPGTGPLTLALAGLAVGFGTRLGNGCTSGHGVCGLSRGSGRSLVATLTFMATGFLTVFVVRHALHLGGGQP